ncbi:transmembrane protein 26-like [Lineus longissimus]|uniref:transmembrane protein 26-like n=1 Tax=Lineus longissimus TaxID=88925 RepID=UPI002B4EBB40
MVCCQPCDDSYQKKHMVACDIFSSLITRFLFFLQCFISIWRVVDAKERNGDPKYNMYWLLCGLMIGLVVDSIYTIGHRKGKEYKWASSSFFFFLVAAVPPIWMLELDRWDRYEAASKNLNVTLKQEAEKLSDFAGIEIPLYLQPDTWVQVLEQSLILLLVPTRWILPRGAITRERLSQILLVYVALGADIIELFDLFELKVVMQDFNIFLAILGVWSLSLLQFTLLLASSGGGRKERFAFISEYSDPNLESRKGSKGRKYDPIEVAALCMTLAFQDIPFLCVRLYIMVKYQLITNTLLFFACKNIYVILLQIYRIFVITCLPPEDSVSKGRRKSNQDVQSDAETDRFDNIAEGVDVDPSATPAGINGKNGIPLDKSAHDGDLSSAQLY